MTTLRQVEANRRNAQKSTGPRTENGKEQSRGNRYTHGLAGDGVVLADDEAEIVANRLVSWGREYDPKNQDEKFLFEQMVLETVRIERCQHHEQSLLYRQVVRAEESWDDDRTLDAVQLAARLSKRPELVAIQLQSTTQGCALLVDRWTGLLEALKPDHPWDDPQRSLAMDLLGIVLILREAFTKLDPGPDQDVVAHQSALARREIERLTLKKLDRLDPRDDHERELAINGYALPNRELNLLRRYEAACHRRLERAMRALAPTRRTAVATPAPAPPARSIREIMGYGPDPIEIADEKEADAEPVAEIDPRGFALVEDTPQPSEEPPVMTTPAVSQPPGARPLMSPQRSFDAPVNLISSVVSASSGTSSIGSALMARPQGNRKERRALQMRIRQSAD